THPGEEGKGGCEGDGFPVHPRWSYAGATPSQPLTLINEKAFSSPTVRSRPAAQSRAHRFQPRRPTDIMMGGSRKSKQLPLLCATERDGEPMLEKSRPCFNNLTT
ncbi:hypothetical protein KUCAC02_006328, partial [Chaenocephalus aceratus]